jgi:hypothetical protein
MPQPLTWNIGTTGIVTSVAEMLNTSGWISAMACSTVERWEKSTPLGMPVVPEV